MPHSHFFTYFCVAHKSQRMCSLMHELNYIEDQVSLFWVCMHVGVPLTKNRMGTQLMPCTPSWEIASETHAGNNWYGHLREEFSFAKHWVGNTQRGYYTFFLARERDWTVLMSEKCSPFSAQFELRWFQKWQDYCHFIAVPPLQPIEIVSYIRTKVSFLKY